MMQVMWFSANSVNDMCFTSQKSLVKGLLKNGYDVQFINKDSPDSTVGLDCQHIAINSSNFPGIKSSTLGKNMAKWLIKQEIDHPAVAIVDWRLIAKLHSALSKANIPWILLDRSPPADTGILAKLQWPVWRRAWKLVANSHNAKGAVVSSSHQQYVAGQISISPNKFCLLPAGVDLEVFSPVSSNDGLKLIYHGRLDKHRGVLALPMLVRKSISAGLDISLKLIGDGDCYDELQQIAKDIDSISVYPPMTSVEVAQHLRESTIGVLPMPEIDVWAISSPLKRSEYCASGLLIFGIDHNGHRFDQSDYSWMKLVPQYDFHEEGVKWLSELNTISISDLSKSSRKFAVDNLSWDIPVKSLIETIHSISES